MESPISSSGGIRSKIGLILMVLFLSRVIYNQFDFSFLAFITTVVCFFVFSYLLAIVFYNPNIFYNDNCLSFTKFLKKQETISFKQIVRLRQNFQSYIAGGSHSRYDYKIEYIDRSGKLSSVNFYSKESQEINMKELIGLIRKANSHFILDWTVPKKVW